MSKMMDTSMMKEFRVGDYRDHIKGMIASHSPKKKLSPKRRMKRAKSNKYAGSSGRKSSSDLY
jgi:hypothetical protein